MNKKKTATTTTNTTTATLDYFWPLTAAFLSPGEVRLPYSFMLVWVHCCVLHVHAEDEGDDNGREGGEDGKGFAEK